MTNSRRWYYLQNAYSESNALVKCAEGFKVSTSLTNEEGMERFNLPSRVKDFNGVTVDKANASESDLTKINKLAIVPLTLDQIEIYKVNLANTKIDRVMDKFSPELLKVYAKRFAGKSVLFNHDKYDGLPVGMVYDAKTFEEEGETVLQVFFYVLKNETELIQKVNAGIWRHFSISFTQPKYEAVYNADQTLKYWNLLPNDPKSGRVDEPTEMSIVYLGAQFGSNATKSVNSGQSPKPVTSGNQPKKKGLGMKLLISSEKSLFSPFRLAVAETDEDGTELEKAISGKIEELVSAVKTEGEKALSDLKAETETVKGLVCDKIVSGKVLNAEIENNDEAKTAEKSALMSKNLTELVNLQDDYSRKIALAKKLDLSGNAVKFETKPEETVYGELPKQTI